MIYIIIGLVLGILKFMDKKMIENLRFMDKKMIENLKEQEKFNKAVKDTIGNICNKINEIEERIDKE